MVRIATDEQAGVSELQDYLCIDVGFTQTRHVRVKSGTMGAIQRVRTINTTANPRRSPDQRRELWLDWLKTEIGPHFEQGDAPDRIGICLPGPVSSEGVISAANSLWGNASDPLTCHQLSALLGRPVEVVNDLVAAATFHGAHPSLTDAEMVLVVNVGSGIGSKFYDRKAGHVLLGPHGLNGEIGFSIVEWGSDAAVTLDGNLRGTLGLYASGSGFARMLRAMAQDAPGDFAGSMIADLLAEKGLEIATADRIDINAAAVAALAAGDTLARAAIRRSIDYLARALHIAILQGAPDRLVLAGGFAMGIGEFYRAALVEALVPMLQPLHTPAEVDRMVVMGQGDGTENLQGLTLLLMGRDERAPRAGLQ